VHGTVDQPDRQFAHFVEEQHAAIGDFEQAWLGFCGPGERAADVSEEFALEERLDDRGAVDRDEAPENQRLRSCDATIA
jgi:hypothetical protein